MTRTNDTAEVVIIGAGFAGLYAAQALKRAPVRVTVLDRRNHHLFQPLLYQVATAGLNPSDIAYPVRTVLRRQKNARVLLADVTRIDTARKTVEYDGGSIQFDYLVLATGATHSYFGHPEWAAFAPGLKTIEDALEIRGRVFLAYEEAERTLDREQQAECLTFVVVGGGPTGVELAGTLGEIAHHSMKRDFRAIDPSLTSVVLIEGVDRVLPPYPEKLSRAAERQLEKLGVTVRTSCLVTDIDAHGVTLKGGERIPSRTVLWAAGVAASPLARTLGAPLDRAGRIEVAADLTVPGHPEIFVAGDLAALRCEGAQVPGVAPAAIQEGKHAAKNIRRAMAGQPLEPFRYRDKGSLATIGRAAAVASFKRFKLSGFLAWWAWWAIHIFFLIGFRSRLLVMFSWAWSYLTFQRGARLITGTPRAQLSAGAPARTPSGSTQVDEDRVAFRR
jgi:NADH:ubiquinone reductase (H+-translocating)